MMVPTTATRVFDVLCVTDLAPALVTPDGTITHAELRSMATARADRHGFDDRSVVVLHGRNSMAWIVEYLALLAGGHVPLLAGDRHADLVGAWSPTASIDADTGAVTRVGRGPGIVPHPDLALLMSTSGSTGSPKLIRLSHDNLVANARSIAEFQALEPDDRGITNLPLHYSFGLSVLHSHLVAGGSIAVTDVSVVDPCFASFVADAGATNLAGVPHTFDLLEQAGPDRLRVPSLRFLAQAGGRMDPRRTEAWARRAHGWGVEWFTMYGQTEATARISYVPAELAGRSHGAVGVPVPGGSIRIDAPDADGMGEIVYRGPNVMMGYATSLRDLEAGPSVDELRTGDLGRFDPATGLLHVTGRRARHVKPFGLRIDLDHVERRLEARGLAVQVAGDDDLIVAVVSSTPPDVDPLDALVAETSLPTRHLAVVEGEPPRLPNGKVDALGLLAVARHARRTEPATEAVSGASVGVSVEAEICDLFAEVIGRGAVAPDDSFVSLGGDSLSYVECSIRLEPILRELPADWHLTPIRQLVPASDLRQFARIDTTVVLRSIGILAVVSTHMRLWHVPGGAHLMLGVAGYNLARFMLPIDDTRERVRAGLRTVGRVAFPTLVWTAAFMLAGQYTWTTLSLVNNYIGPASHSGNHWHFWFVEVFVHLVLSVTAFTAIPAVRRADQRWPYAFPLVLLAATLALRMGWADLGDWYNLRFRTHAVAWFFVLGWLVLRSVRLPHRLLTTALCIATAPGVFQNPRREFFIAAGLVLLVWVKEVPLPRVLVRPVATIAAASMWILISHFMIWPPLKASFVIEVAYPLTVMASVGVWWIATRLPRLVRNRVGDGARRSDPAVHPAVHPAYAGTLV